jgi:hypothetical protein
VLEVVFQTKVETFGVVCTRIDDVFVGLSILFAVLGSGLAPQQGVQVPLVVLRHGVVFGGQGEIGSISHQVREDLVLFDDPEVLHVIFVKPFEEMGHGKETGEHVVAGQMESVLVKEHEHAVNVQADLVQLKDQPSCEHTADAVVVCDTFVIGM